MFLYRLVDDYVIPSHLSLHYVGEYICGGKKYTITLWVMMKRVIYEFLNTKYEGIVIYHQMFDLSDGLMESFITDRGNGIIKFTRFHSRREIRTRVNSFLRGDIKKYFDIHDIDIEMYVLEWCRDKSIKTVEM